MSVVLSSCGSAEDYCNTPNLEALFQKYFNEQLIVLMNSSDNKQDAKVVTLMSTTVSNVLSLIDIDIDIEDVQSLSQQSGKRTAQCNAKIKVSVPPPLLDLVDDYRVKNKQGLFSDYVKELGLDNKENSFTQNIHFIVMVANTPEASKVQFDSYAWEHLLSQLVIADMDHPLIKELKPAAMKPVIQSLQNETVTAKTVQKTPEPIETSSDNLIQNDQSKLSGPSFDCSKADKQTDNAICLDPHLSTLDVDNMTVYKKAKVINPDKTQAIWRESIKYKYACGTEVDCITKIYEKTIKLYGCVIKNAACQNQIAF